MQWLTLYQGVQTYYSHTVNSCNLGQGGQSGYTTFATQIGGRYEKTCTIKYPS